MAQNLFTLFFVLMGTLCYFFAFLIFSDRM